MATKRRLPSFYAKEDTGYITPETPLPLRAVLPHCSPRPAGGRGRSSASAQLLNSRGHWTCRGSMLALLRWATCFAMLCEALGLRVQLAHHFGGHTHAAGRSRGVSRGHAVMDESRPLRKVRRAPGATGCPLPPHPLLTRSVAAGGRDWAGHHHLAGPRRALLL